MTAYVKSRLAEGQYGNVNEFFRDLVRRDQELRKQAVAELRALIDRAEADGISDKGFSQAFADA